MVMTAQMYIVRHSNGRVNRAVADALADTQCRHVDGRVDDLDRGLLGLQLHHAGLEPRNFGQGRPPRAA